ncbi:MAG: Ig-like domain-containing protein [Imperialibacter sp.]|uniref:Ig-like domain-containing protein n=1 Tax=Imperialibacter sp. TaxID=2038411 RepID=UPI0032EC86A4
MNQIKTHASIFLLALVVAFGCDTLDVDSLPEPAATASTELVTLPGGAIVFSLSDIVKPTSDATSQIALGPSSGTLESLGGQLFRYVPGFASPGKDRTVFKTTFSGSSTQRLDTISFEVKAASNAQDSLGLPCTIIAADDFRRITTESPVQIDVLSNDFVCSSLTLANPPISVVHMPEYGTISVTERGFTFTKQPSITAKVDTVIYKVCSAGSAPVCAWGVVYLELGDTASSCDISLSDDQVELTQGVGGTTLINVFENDTLCELSNIGSFSITQQPEFGVATIHQPDSGVVTYKLVSGDFAGEDKFTYKVCDTDNQCYSADVYLTRSECMIAARDDHFYISDTLHVDADEAIIEILFNDELCSEDLMPVIVMEPQHGSALIDQNNHLVYSDFSSLEQLDSLRYKLCDGFEVCSEATVLIQREN